ncbi:MAG: NTP transferase domain-containing protein [Novosphingobium sp.]
MKLVSVVLAAGSSTRFGSDKLSAMFRGEPLLRHAIRAARAAPVERVIVVCRPGLDIGEWDGPPPVSPVRVNSDAISTSLKAGIAAAGDADGAFIFLGDMPLVPHHVAGKLAERLDDSFAVLPRHRGSVGHPVLLSVQAFPEIAGLDGDQGAGKLLRERTDIAYEEIADPAIHLDIDRAEDLARLETPGESSP